jgi:molybdenum cofactor biosynthesis enzyme MoaA
MERPTNLFRRIMARLHTPPDLVAVVLPTSGQPRLADAARQLINALRLHAHVLAGGDVRVLAVDAEARVLWCAETGHRLRLSFLRRPRLSVFMTPAFLLSDTPPLASLIEAAERNTLAWCGTRSTADLHACACRGGECSTDRLWSSLRILSVCLGDRVDAQADADSPWTARQHVSLIPPDNTSPDNSPALDDVANRVGRRAFDAPMYVNTAFRELLTMPADAGAVGGRPERMLAALVGQRRGSRVPWVFNSLINEIEFRVGAREPQSIPPEVHLSITGLCNIECRFCAYTHDIARRDQVDEQQVAKLDFLQFAQTFRLHSGLGDPTVNRHLPAIIEHVAARFPHLTTNFFTNAITLGRPPLLDALVGRISWINASLNAAGRDTWQAVCDANAELFDRVIHNLRLLHQAKRTRQSLQPQVFGSMVLTAANVDDLPRMPALCRSLGIDRFTAFPYFGLGYHGHRKYGGEMTLEACRDRYDQIYDLTVREAQQHAISLEIPLPSPEKRTAFGLEARPLHDFARIETNQWRLGRFVAHLDYDRPPGAHCHFLWRSAGIGSTNRAGHAAEETHYLYPCIGPLSSLDLSRRTAFRFPGTQDFLSLWRNPVFEHLRQAQHRPGVSPVCDICRGCDTRDPEHFPQLEQLVAAFAREHCGIPS